MKKMLKCRNSSETLYNGKKSLLEVQNSNKSEFDVTKYNPV